MQFSIKNLPVFPIIRKIGNCSILDFTLMCLCFCMTALRPLNPQKNNNRSLDQAESNETHDLPAILLPD